MGSLNGLRIAVTRAPAQAGSLRRLLEAEGARVRTIPLIRTVAWDADGLAQAVRAQSYDWVVFTSANAIRFTDAALGPGLLARTLGGARVACVGPATARAAREAGLAVSAQPDDHQAGGLAEAMARTGRLQGAAVLWPRAAAASERLRELLLAAGARVTDPVAYRTMPDARGAAELATTVLQGDVDIVTFTSPSCVQSLAAALPDPGRTVRFAVIGPVTAEAARAAGYTVHVQADEHTDEGLVQALLASATTRTEGVPAHAADGEDRRAQDAPVVRPEQHQHHQRNHE